MQFIIIKIDGTTCRYLIHEGFAHRWSTNREDAMIYSIEKVAADLSAKYGGQVVRIH